MIRLRSFSSLVIIVSSERISHPITFLLVNEIAREICGLVTPKGGRNKSVFIPNFANSTSVFCISSTKFFVGRKQFFALCVNV